MKDFNPYIIVSDFIRAYTRYFLWLEDNPNEKILIKRGKFEYYELRKINIDKEKLQNKSIK